MTLIRLIPASFQTSFIKHNAIFPLSCKTPHITPESATSQTVWRSFFQMDLFAIFRTTQLNFRRLRAFYFLGFYPNLKNFSAVKSCDDKQSNPR